MGRRLAFTLPGWVSTQSCSLWQRLWDWAVSFMDTRLKKPARGGTLPEMSERDFLNKELADSLIVYIPLCRFPHLTFSPLSLTAAAKKCATLKSEAKL